MLDDNFLNPKKTLFIPEDPRTGSIADERSVTFLFVIKLVRQRIRGAQFPATAISPFHIQRKNHTPGPFHPERGRQEKGSHNLKSREKQHRSVNSTLNVQPPPLSHRKRTPPKPSLSLHPNPQFKTHNSPSSPPPSSPSPSSPAPYPQRSSCSSTICHHASPPHPSHTQTKTPTGP